MKQVPLKDIQENFVPIFGDVLVSGGLVKILKVSGNAILVSEEVWRGLTETVNLVSKSGMLARDVQAAVSLGEMQGAITRGAIEGRK